MNQVVKYDKTLQERLQEYKEIFEDCTTVCEAKHNLSIYLEMEMDHCGWQAVWKIPRITCEDLKIPYPTFVLVFVVNMNCLKQIAEIRVLCKQIYIDIAENHIVPLTQLSLTKEQDNKLALNLESTGNALDVLQFFFTNLYMPWDEEDNSNWIENHLEQRLRLFYDIKNGIVPQSMAEQFKFLISEVKRLQVKCLSMQKFLKDQNVDCEDECDEALNEIVEMQVKMMEMQKEFELLENPIARKVFIKRHQEELKLKKQEQEKRFWIVCKGTRDDCVMFLEKLKVQYPCEVFKTAMSLMMALENPDVIDLIAVSKGEHKIKDFGCLEMNGVIKATFNRDDTIITSSAVNIMFDISGCVTFENLTIDATKSQCAILVRSGKVILKNCKIVGDNVSTTHQGFIVLKGSALELIDCFVTGFGTAFVGNSNAYIRMNNCEIFSVGYGLKVHDDCTVDMKNSIFHQCREYAVLVETEDSLYSKEEVADFSILNKCVFTVWNFKLVFNNKLFKSIYFLVNLTSVSNNNFNAAYF